MRALLRARPPVPPRRARTAPTADHEWSSPSGKRCQGKVARPMRTETARRLDSGIILAHFLRRRSHDWGQYLHNVAYHLMRMILTQQEFDSLESLMAFCGAPENLRPWLPAEADRIILSRGLTQGLNEIPSD